MVPSLWFCFYLAMRLAVKAGNQDLNGHKEHSARIPKNVFKELRASSMKPWVFVFSAKLIFILDFRIFWWSLATKIASNMAPMPTSQRWRTQMHPRSAWRFNADVDAANWFQLMPWRNPMVSRVVNHTRPGKRLHNYGKSQFLMEKLTISMAIFNSFLYVYQRVTCLSTKDIPWDQLLPTSTLRVRCPTRCASRRRGCHAPVDHFLREDSQVTTPMVGLMKGES